MSLLKHMFVKRAILIVVAVGLYFAAGRPVRKLITTHLVAPVVQLEDGMLYGAIQKSTGVTMYDLQTGDVLFTLYTLFGSFFLFGVIGFVAVGAPRGFYLFLTLWHLVLGLIAVLFIRFALHYDPAWIHAAIFVQNLLLHWMTVLLVPLALYWVKHSKGIR